MPTNFPNHVMHIHLRFYLHRFCMLIGHFLYFKSVFCFIFDVALILKCLDWSGGVLLRMLMFKNLDEWLVFDFSVNGSGVCYAFYLLIKGDICESSLEFLSIVVCMIRKNCTKGYFFPCEYVMVLVNRYAW